MGLLLNRRREMGGEALPYDAQIEYLQGTGTQYINTGVTPTSNIKIVLKVKLNAGLNESPISGDAWAASHPFLMVYNSRVRWHLGSTLDTDATFSAGAVCEIEASNGSMKVNNVTKTGTPLSYTQFSNQMHIFATNGRYGQMNLYYYKLYEGNTLLHDFIPVRIGQVGYLYDKVSKTLFSNAGSGSFTLGPDV